MTANPLHQSLTAERYTPIEVAQAVQALNPNGFFDIASCDLANTIMGATGYYTKADDALTLLPKAYLGDCFLNPPGGRLKNHSLQRLFWETALQAYREHRIRSLVFLSFSSNGVAICPEMLHYPIVFTTREATSPCVNKSGRICFLSSYQELERIIYEETETEISKHPGNDKAKTRIWQKAATKLAALDKLPKIGDDLVRETKPTNPGAIVYLPPRLNNESWHSVYEFRDKFKQFGTFPRVGMNQIPPNTSE